jgi:hypothetical protein
LDWVVVLQELGVLAKQHLAAPRLLLVHILIMFSYQMMILILEQTHRELLISS